MAVSVTLNMGISDEIEVATIPFNQTTILEMKARIAELPLRWRLTTLVVDDGKEICQKALLQVQSFCFAY